MNSGAYFPTPAVQPSSLTLEITGLSHIPSFKNSKMIARGKLITNPRKQQWMEACIRSFVSQFISAAQTTGQGTLTEQQRRSWIASRVPADDSRQWIFELLISCSTVPKGQEGATIIIERI